MAPSVLGIGIPASPPLVSRLHRGIVQKGLNELEADMQASPYDWEMFFFTPEMELDLLIRKLREKKWDIVMVGVGIRTIVSLTPFFEKIINTVREESPQAKFAFNAKIAEAQEACRRVLVP